METTVGFALTAFRAERWVDDCGLNPIERPHPDALWSKEDPEVCCIHIAIRENEVLWEKVGECRGDHRFACATLPADDCQTDHQ
jgi:hypothetical protein